MIRFIVALAVLACAPFTYAAEKKITCSVVVRLLTGATEKIPNGLPFVSKAPPAEGEVSIQLLPAGSPLARAHQTGISLGRHRGGRFTDNLYLLTDKGTLRILNPYSVRIENGRKLRLKPNDFADAPTGPRTKEDVAREEAAVEAIFARMKEVPPIPVPHRDAWPPAGAWDSAAFKAWSEDGARYQREQARFAERRHLLPLLVGIAKDRARLKQVLMGLLAHDPDPELKTAIPAMMYREGLLENEDMNAIVHAPIENADVLSRWHHFGNERYWNDLLDVFYSSRVEARRERLPLELIPIYGLLHPDVNVRSRSIDQIRIMANPGSWAPIENDAAWALLKEIRPKVTGHAADTIDFALRQGRYGALPETTGKKPPTAGELVYRKLLLDTCGDCAGFPELAPDLKAELVGMRRHIETGKPLDELMALKKVAWGSLDAKWPAAVNGEGQWRVWQLKGRDRTDDIGHSMGEVDKYLEGWLGRELVYEVQHGNVEVIVFAGNLARLRSRLEDFDPAKLKRLPSPYAEWGIEKYFYDRDGKPLIFISIPPIEQYARHYVHLLHEAEAKSGMVILDETSRERHLGEWRAASKSLVGRLTAKPNRLVLGYAAQWKAALKDHPDWKVTASEEVNVKENGMELTGTLLSIEHELDPGNPEKILFVTSGKTWWGEAAQALTQGVLDSVPSVKDVWFMGSAGSIGVNAAYPVSVPSSFGLPGKSLEIANSMLPNGLKGHGIHHDPNQGPMPVPLHLGGGHGFSDSPAQQSRDFVTGAYGLNRVSSIDVESPLIAQMIQSRNEGKPEAERVGFGAAYVLTDHPAGFFTYDIGASLAEVGSDHKAKARDRVVELALDSLAQSHLKGRDVKELFGAGHDLTFRNSFHRGGTWIYPTKRPPSWIRYLGVDNYMW